MKSHLSTNEIFVKKGKTSMWKLSIWVKELVPKKGGLKATFVSDPIPVCYLPYLLQIWD